MMKVFLRLILSLQLTLAPMVAQSQSSNFATSQFTSKLAKSFSPKAFALTSEIVWNTYGPELKTRAQAKGWALGKSIVGAPASAAKLVAHSGQTLVIIWVIQVIAIVKEEIRQARLRGVEVNKETVKQLTINAAEHLISNPEIYASIMGGFVTGAVANNIKGIKPIASGLNEAYDLMADTLKSPVAAAHFKTLLVSGAMSTITFMGWEAGTILWQDAILALGNIESNNPEIQKQIAEDLKIAHNLKMGNIIASLWNRKAMTGDEKRVLGLLLMNMQATLMNDNGKRWQWFYNTWRKRIATGDFVILVSSMTLAGVAGGVAGAAAGAKVGSALGLTGGVPGMAVMGFFGLAAGFVAGVAGGMILVFIPQHVKDSITEFLTDVRIRNSENFLKQNQALQLGKIKLFAHDSFKNRVLQKVSFQSMQSILRQRQTNRELYVNAWLERFHNATLVKEYAEFENQVAAMSSDPELNEKLTALIAGEEHETQAGTQLQHFIQQNGEHINAILEDIDAERVQNNYVQQARAEEVEANRKKLARANNNIKQALTALTQLYRNDAQALTDVYLAEIFENGGSLPDNMDNQVRSEIGETQGMQLNLLFLLAGFEPSLAKTEPELKNFSQQDILSQKTPARVLLNMYFEIGYSEDMVLEKMYQAIEELSQENGTDQATLVESTPKTAS